MGLRVGEVKLVKWNQKWLEDFEREKQTLQDLFDSLALNIQHVGSTSAEFIDDA